MVSTKILSSTTVFNIDNIFCEDQIMILEWFLKDQVTRFLPLHCNYILLWCFKMKQINARLMSLKDF